MFKLSAQIAAWTLIATPVFAAPCKPDSWTSYLASAGCTIGHQEFSSFSFDAGSSGLTSDAVKAQPDGLGLLFTIDGFSAATMQGQTQSKTMTLNFKVTTVKLTHPLTAETLEFVTAAASSNADAVIKDQVEGLLVHKPDSLTFGPEKNTDSKTFDPARTTVTVKEELSLSTGMGASSASISSFRVSFTAAPAPGTLALLGLAFPIAVLLCRFPGAQRTQRRRVIARRGLPAKLSLR